MMGELQWFLVQIGMILLTDETHVRILSVVIPLLLPKRPRGTCMNERPSSIGDVPGSGH